MISPRIKLFSSSSLVSVTMGATASSKLDGFLRPEPNVKAFAAGFLAGLFMVPGWAEHASFL